MTETIESLKQSVREAFSRLRAELPEEVTPSDANFLEDLALRCLDRGLKRPAVFAHEEECEISIQFAVPREGQENATIRLPAGTIEVYLYGGFDEVYAFSAAAGDDFGMLSIHRYADERARDRFADAIAEKWALVQERLSRTP